MMSKNSYVSNKFIQTHIELFQIFLALRSHYPKLFQQFSKIEAGSLGEDVTAKPDIYLRRIDEDKEPGEYFLYYITDNQLFIIKRLLKKILKDYEDWPSDEYYPVALLVCPSPSVERRVSGYLLSLDLDDDFLALTTTPKALLQAENPEVWTSYNTEQLLVDLKA